jgi:uncharacterized protein GlcG (DUF336 family)
MSRSETLKLIICALVSLFSVPENIAVLDPSAFLVAFVHMDNAFLGSIDVSIKKAKTSVLYNGIPSNALLNRSGEWSFPPRTRAEVTIDCVWPWREYLSAVILRFFVVGRFPSFVGLNSDCDAETGGDVFAIQETNGGTVVFGGGVPIIDNSGYFIGAVGVSGGTVAQDIDVAVAAAEAIGTTESLNATRWRW